ncbi:MAG: hypothetical protein JSW55_13695 [Chloroflexota bacterium]|nr:MAG: hypothetical protein JSW55_13695 [Chloroflexota bacterium]
MSFSEYLTSAVNTLASVPPSRLAAVMSGAVGFLAAFALLPGADSDAPAGNQQIIVWAGSLITAFLASQLAAYLLRIAEHRPSWPNLSSPRKLAVTLILALVSAGIVLGLMLLVS